MDYITNSMINSTINLMNNILSNAKIQRTIPSWQAIRLASRVPVEVLRQARAYHANTPNEVLFQMLDAVGIEAIADIVSQGCFVYDVATALDIPVTKFREWLDADSSRIDKIEKAEELSAEAYLSQGTQIIMGVGATDTDAARVAKMKSDHLVWLAKSKDRETYGDKVNQHHTGGQPIEYRISLSPAVQQGNIIDVDVG